MQVKGRWIQCTDHGNTFPRLPGKAELSTQLLPLFPTWRMLWESLIIEEAYERSEL